MGDTAVEPTLHWTDGSAVRESSSASHTTGTDVRQRRGVASGNGV